ncbi:DUF4440 domain-containing protein [Actinomadura sp. LD22]|uniref:DUF4440 domain-containing protein n=1 Tax=Actinomadura physcomitrii TaxID=2650748 RepID=A0A6I4MC11_9ACTN|nr:nuclear transport factor 2 family protein [Actinomadura physcomitrii]MVZ99665.1 DUF4440 domain-containing protein [Actinomadura physcomitrii]
MDEIVRQAHAALAARDWEAARPLLHPYLHWTGADGRTLRGRTKVLAMLEEAAQAPAPPASVELRDGQIYRWRA